MSGFNLTSLSNEELVSLYEYSPDPVIQLLASRLYNAGENVKRLVELEEELNAAEDEARYWKYQAENAES